jgi:coenzyme F420-reducing hydrogenase beta subunit
VPLKPTSCRECGAGGRLWRCGGIPRCNACCERHETARLASLSEGEPVTPRKWTEFEVRPATEAEMRKRARAFVNDARGLLATDQVIKAMDAKRKAGR